MCQSLLDVVVGLPPTHVFRRSWLSIPSRRLHAKLVCFLSKFLKTRLVVSKVLNWTQFANKAISTNYRLKLCFSLFAIYPILSYLSFKFCCCCTHSYRLGVQVSRAKEIGGRVVGELKLKASVSWYSFVLDRKLPSSPQTQEFRLWLTKVLIWPSLSKLAAVILGLCCASEFL